MGKILPLVLLVTGMPNSQAGLRAYWSFDINPDSVIHDSLGASPGVIHGAVRSPGKCNYALSFDGNDDYVEVPDSDTLDITDAISLCAWVHPSDSMPGWGMGIIDKSSFSGTWGSYRLIIGYLSWKPGFSIMAGGRSWDLEADSAILSNQWTHLVGTYDGKDMKLYINGALNKTYPQTGPIDTDSNNVRIGHYMGPNRFFNGIIDEVRIYDHALSEPEVQAIYTTCVVGMAPGSRNPRLKPRLSGPEGIEPEYFNLLGQPAGRPDRPSGIYLVKPGQAEARLEKELQLAP